MTPTPNTDALRWLLRVLGDDAFLRLYVEEHQKSVLVSTSEVERTLWSLSEDAEHQSRPREVAWNILQHAQIPEPAGTSPQHIFLRTRNYLLPRLKGSSLPAYYGLDFLFRNDDDSIKALPHIQCIQSTDGTFFTETHAHFRGSVPLDFLWDKLMKDARLRALHREKFVKVGPWSQTRAELLTRASAITNQPGQPAFTTSAALKLLNDPTYTGCLKSAVALLAIRANFGRHFTYQRSEAGLSRFTQAYERFSNAAKLRGASKTAKERDDIEQVREVLAEFQRRGVRGVELRPTIEPTRIEIQAKLRPLVLGYLCHIQESADGGRPPLTFGIVPSLFKQDGLNKQSDCNEATANDWVYEQSDRWCNQVEGLLDILATVPALRLFIVGIDAAGREQGCPVRALAPAYAKIAQEHLRHRLKNATPGRRMGPWLQALQALVERAPSGNRLGNAWRVWEQINSEWGPRITPIRLGRTIHVGEDFVDPVTGLREIWEAIDHLGLTHGDRLGHALAAGLCGDQLKHLLNRRAHPLHSPNTRFVEPLPPDSYRLAKPIGVHLLDEEWSSRLLGRNGSDVLLAAGHTFSAHAGLSSIRADIARRGPTATLRVPGLHFSDLDKVPREYLTWITVDDDYRRRFDELRSRVGAKIHTLGLVIESCPTSNIVVAGMRSPPLKTFLDEDFAVTIASDDPAIFNAWPDDELRYLDGDSAQRDRIIKQSDHASFI